MQSQVVRGEFTIVGWTFGPVVQLAEQVLHHGVRPLDLLVDACLLRDYKRGSLLGLAPSWLHHVLLRLVIGLLSVCEEQFRHMVNNHADPLAIHDLKTTHALEMPIALLEGLKDLIRIACGLPALLLIEMPRVLQKVDGPLRKSLPICRVLSDNTLLGQEALSLHEFLWYGLLVNPVLAFHLDVRLE